MTLFDANGVVFSRYRLELLTRIERVPCRASRLSVIAFSDWRVQDISALVRFIKALEKPDLILYAGDDIKRFRADTKNLLRELAKLSRFGLCAVAGNDDLADARKLIAGRGVHAVHSCALVLGRFAIVGVEGAPLSKDLGPNYNLGYLLYPEPILAEQMKRWSNRAFRGKKLIVVSHTPPYGVLDFAVRFGPRSIGNRPLREFLESSQSTLLCVCGHVHRCGGQTARVGTALVVNAASHDSAGSVGKAAVIQIRETGMVEVKWWSI